LDGNGEDRLRYLFEDYALDTDRRELHRVADLIALTPQVFDLLDYLLRHRERVVSKDDLIAAVWGGRAVSDSALTTRINAVRTALSDDGRAQRLVKTLPRRGFRFVGPVREAQGPNIAADVPRSTLALPGKPSIAVLPFANLGDDRSEDHFSDGMTEDIITELSRFSELFVIARNSSFQYRGEAVDVRQVGRELGVHYILEGSVRRQGDRVRIVGQLIDAVTGAHHWAERYDRDLKDVLTVQDEVARAIATVLVAHVNKAEVERTLLKPPENWRAYDYYVRGAGILASYWSTVEVADLHESRRLIEKSLAIDPNFARAHSTLSTTYLIAWLNRLDRDHLQPATLDRAWQLASRAVQLDPGLPHAHASLGAVLVWKRQHEAAVAEFEKARALNPNFTDWRIAIALVYAGEAARAVEILQQHMRLDPFYPPLAPHWLGVAYYALKQYSLALSQLKECALRAPNYGAVHHWLAATHARLGQMDDARAEAARVLQLDPGFTVERAAQNNIAFKYREDGEHCFDAMREAGLPNR
jgi:adenylate cyclase